MSAASSFFHPPFSYQIRDGFPAKFLLTKEPLFEEENRDHKEDGEDKHSQPQDPWYYYIENLHGHFHEPQTLHKERKTNSYHYASSDIAKSSKKYYRYYLIM